jgi:hypothetical protein
VAPSVAPSVATPPVPDGTQTAILVPPSSPPAPTPSATPWPSRTLGPSEYWLPSLPDLAQTPGGSPQACAGVGIGLAGASQQGMPLNGSRTDPRYVWLGPAGIRRDLVWPPGYSVRFTASGFEILDQTGAVRHRSGDWIDGGCITSDPDTLWLPDW